MAATDLMVLKVQWESVASVQLEQC